MRNRVNDIDLSTRYVDRSVSSFNLWQSMAIRGNLWQSVENDGQGDGSGTAEEVLICGWYNGHGLAYARGAPRDDSHIRGRSGEAEPRAA